ncbi:MAG: hypothetical protein M1833_005274 [Piccolia ochrophora]|nr:MAG: hypothetical protein M1833_005274 [Piccolia ochrophora]
MSLTAAQTQAMVITEKVNSSISIASIIFIVTSFMFTKSFTKSIHRQIFFASWSSLAVNVAAVISNHGIQMGQSSPLCQVQAFLVQMFLGVDAYWACCMACNVYLIFFRGYTTEQLRALDVRYQIGCYGASFIPACVYCFINTSRGRIYGPAVIWCWITAEWHLLRMVTLYAIVWVAMALALVIYFMAGMVIWKKRDQLQGFLNPLNEHPLAPTVVTEVFVVAEDVGPILPPQRQWTDEKKRSESLTYTVNVEAAVLERRPSNPAIFQMRTLTRTAAEMEENTEALLYARVSFLFFVVMIITWVPGSINRIYSLIYPDRLNFGLNYASSFVFPLQGLWNGIVYCLSSQTACKELWHTVRTWRKRRTRLRLLRNEVELNTRYNRRPGQRQWDSEHGSIAPLA